MHEITLFSIGQQTAQECDPWENERKGDKNLYLPQLSAYWHFLDHRTEREKPRGALITWPAKGTEQMQLGFGEPSTEREETLLRKLRQSVDPSSTNRPSTSVVKDHWSKHKAGGCRPENSQSSHSPGRCSCLDQQAQRGFINRSGHLVVTEKGHASVFFFFSLQCLVDTFLFICGHHILVAACGIWCSDQGSNPPPPALGNVCNKSLTKYQQLNPAVYKKDNTLSWILSQEFKMVLIWGGGNDSMYLTFSKNKEDNHIISVNAEKNI